MTAAQLFELTHEETLQAIAKAVVDGQMPPGHWSVDVSLDIDAARGRIEKCTVTVRPKGEPAP